LYLLAARAHKIAPRGFRRYSPPVTDVESAYGACARIARAHSENFPTASRLLPAGLSRHLAAFYAFARAGDDWADEPGHGDAAERRGKLHAWRARLLAPPDGHPVFVALAQSRKELGLDTALFERLLDAFERDLGQPAYDTWDDLLTYCRDSAEPVGRLVLRAAGDRDEANALLSDRLCTALQLTNFWQDLARDEPRGRSYLPRRERAELGDARALAWAIARTRRLFDDAAPLAGRAPRPLRAWLRAVEAGGRAVLERVERLGPDAFRVRATLGAGDRARMLVRAFGPGLPSSSFGASFLLLPPARREALAALHAFCRALDDEVDEAPTPAEALAGLARAREETSSVLAGAPRSPVGARLVEAWARLGADRGGRLAEGLDALLDGLALDARGESISTDDELERYCTFVGGGPGVAALPVFGQDEAVPFARALGVALQRTNVLRDIAADARAGRIYVPHADLEAFGIDPAALAAPAPPPGARRLARALAARARASFARARAALPRGAARDFAPALGMGAVYEGVLARIEADPGRIWRERVRTPWLEGALRVALARARAR
jgi:phytoene synthase